MSAVKDEHVKGEVCK